MSAGLYPASRRRTKVFGTFAIMITFSLPPLRFFRRSAACSTVIACMLIPAGAANLKMSSIIGVLATTSSTIQMELAPRKPSQPIMTWPWTSRSSMRFMTISDVGLLPPKLVERLDDIDDAGLSGGYRGPGELVEVVGRLAGEKGLEQHRQADAGDCLDVLALLREERRRIGRRAAEHVEQDQDAVAGPDRVRGVPQPVDEPFEAVARHQRDRRYLRQLAEHHVARFEERVR